MKKKIKFLSSKEYKTLLDMARRVSTRDYVLFLLAGNLGLRAGELVRLRKSDFDLQKGVLNTPTLKRGKGRVQRDGLPKVYEELPITFLLTNAVFIKYLGTVKDFLFPGRGGPHIHENGAQRIFKTYIKVMGINASMHALRHFRGDSIYKATKDLVQVNKSLRHRSLRSSFTYVHPGVDEIQEAFKKGGLVQ